MTRPDRSRTTLAALALLSMAGCAADPATESETLDQSTDELGTASDFWWGGRAVYVMDNVASRNAIVRFARGSDGSLRRGAVFPTGGRGTGAGLGSQGALILSADAKRLFAVNAGSDEISWFDIHGPLLVLRDIVGSGGANPIGLTIHGDRLYVVNAGRDDRPGNIAGFEIGDALQPIPGSTQPLSGASVGPAQVQFDPTGDVLLVTEKATNNLVSYRIDGSGRAGPPVVTPSHGQTPFGFAFDSHGTLVVSEAFGGAPGASALSSYRLAADGAPVLVSGSVPTGQTAACWVAIGGGDRFAYTTNTGSNSVSGYSIDRHGALSRFDDGGVTAATGGGPIDLDFSDDGRFLYVLGASADSIDILRARRDGVLESRGRVTGLPASSVGIAAH